MREDLRLLARLAIGFLAGVLLLMLAFSMEANATTHTPNQPDFWGEDCSKIDEYQGGNSWEADQNYRLVVLKAGTQLTIYENVQQGQVLTSGNGKDISHIILCPFIPTSTTTSQPSTTTTEPVLSIPPTSNPPVPLTSTTTQPSDSSTTSVSPSTTVTTVPGSTITKDSSPPSTTPTTSPPAPDGPTELPYTGSNGHLWILGLVSLVAGAGLVAFGRGR